MTISGAVITALQSVRERDEETSEKRSSMWRDSPFAWLWHQSNGRKNKLCTELLRSAVLAEHGIAIEPFRKNSASFIRANGVVCSMKISFLWHRRASRG